MDPLLKSQAVKKKMLAGMVQGFCLFKRAKNPVNLGISSLFLPKSTVIPILRAPVSSL
jgi:hypothetical protein